MTKPPVLAYKDFLALRKDAASEESQRGVREAAKQTNKAQPGPFGYWR